MTQPTKKTAPKVIFTIGGPAAGKSTETAKRYPGLPVVDPDEIKKLHPNYDEKNITDEVHEWSCLMAKREFFERLGMGKTFVLDGTGTNIDKYLMMIENAHEAGFETHLMYVTCTTKTAIERNRNRKRTVKETVVKTKHSRVARAFAILSGYADTTETINTEGK